jgi:hypothetical protein
MNKEISYLENTFGISFGKHPPKVIYFKLFGELAKVISGKSDFYFNRFDLCLLKDKSNVFANWHELAHAYVNRINPRLFRNSFFKDPEKSFISKLMIEGTAEWMSIEAGLRSKAGLKEKAQEFQRKRYFGNENFLYKASVVFALDVEDIVKAGKKSKIWKELVKRIKRMDFATYYLGYNYMVKRMESLDDKLSTENKLKIIINKPPEKIKQIIPVFADPNQKPELN